MNSHSVNRQPPSAFYWLSLLVLPLLTALACRYYFHRQAAVDKTLFYRQSLEVMYLRQAQNLPAGSIVFLGDSQIQGLAVTAISPNAVNFGIGHQQLQHLAKKINDYPGLAQTEKIVIGIGINDLLHTAAFEPEMAIAQLVKGLQCCRDKVLLLSVLPVDEMKLQRPGLNQRIEEFNRQLQVAAQAVGFHFLNLQPSFASREGGIHSKYDLGDGLHLNHAGNEILIILIKSALRQGKINEQ